MEDLAPRKDMLRVPKANICSLFVISCKTKHVVLCIILYNYRIYLCTRRGGSCHIYIYKTFLIYRTCMRRAPAKPVRACTLRNLCPVSHVTFEAPLRTPHFTLHSPHFTLLTSHCFLHFTLHTAHCTLHAPHFTLHSSHSTLHLI